jgi:hypothetical protein
MYLFILDNPKNADDVLAMFTAFSNEHPDGDGSNSMPRYPTRRRASTHQRG